MSHKKKSGRVKRVPKVLLLILVVICAFLITCSKVYHSSFTGTFSTVAGYVIVPLQNACAGFGDRFSNIKVYFTSKKALQEENEELNERIDSLREEINSIEFDTHEYEVLQELYELDETYDAYDKVAADVVASDSGNWFDTFLINRGTDDGIASGMNVIAEGGLVGIVIDAGQDYAKVQSIVDDTCSVSAMDVSTSDYCIVSGSLQTMNEMQMIEFSQLRLTQDEEDSGALTGDLLVTSSISDKYLKGIPIGYVTEIETDSGNLTQSGYLVPIVDFAHLEAVFVILETKDYEEAQ